MTAEQALNHKWIMDQCYASITPSNSKQRKISHQNRRSMTFASYMGMEKLKKAALGYIASNLTRSEIGELEQIFQQIDTNRDGLLTLSELDHALTNRKFSLTRLLFCQDLSKIHLTHWYSFFCFFCLSNFFQRISTLL